MRRLAIASPVTTAWVLFLSVLSGPLSSTTAQEPPKYEPFVAPASDEGARALRSFQLAPGLKGDLFAAEPLMANPVAFGFDAKGRVFVVETFRLHYGVTDTRQHMNWLDDDLASRTIADRVAKYRKYLGARAEDYGKEHDRLRLLVDRDGDGKPDAATVFADGFKNIPDGLASGVLARGGDVFLACIPDLWRLRDKDGDGRADEKTSLHSGYGVHTGFLGHDLHGLILGPDGKLYFSIGDRGLNLKTLDGKTLFLPDTGAVLRCDLDGTNLELFCTGLRNPQELAFDDFGNLFTVDNNSDSGDRARIAYLMEGGDTGWTMGWQYITWPNARGPWNSEKLWHPYHEGQPAHIVPPILNFSDGPSGLTYHPGVSRLPERYQGHFFLCDFRGAAGQSGVHAFNLVPKGAGFAFGKSERVVWGLEATDVDFGPDGALYISDWVEGWDITGKGRLYRFLDPETNPAPAEAVRKLLAEGLSGKSPAELLALLGHADRRIRLEAQYTLAEKGTDAIAAFSGVVADARAPRLARVHATWGLGQVARKATAALEPVRKLTGDPDAEIRAQAARVLGDARDAASLNALIGLLKDQDSRVQSLAAIAVGKLGRAEALAPLADILRANKDADPYLRHAAVMGLAGVGSGTAGVDALKTVASDDSPAVRLGALLAMRRLKAPGIVKFLADVDPRIVAEAARAIYDAPIDTALPELAALAETTRSDLDESTWRRVLNAAARRGGASNSQALADFAAQASRPERLREEALRLLAEWTAPAGRDPVTGLWRPRAEKSGAEAAAALAPVAPGILKDGPGPLRLAVLKAAGPLPLREAAPAIRDVFHNSERFYANVRVEALRALDRLNDPALADAATKAVADRSAEIRVEGRRLLARLRPAEAVAAFEPVLASGSVVEKQGAFATLGEMPPGDADKVLARSLEHLAAGKLDPATELDLTEAAAKRTSPEVARALAAFEASRPKEDPLAPYLGSLLGGNARRGEQIFKEKADVSCVRCHKVNGRGGEVGPELAGVAIRGDRRYLLESLVAPDRQIAKGFETVLVATTDGQIRSGILREETDATLRLINADGQYLTIAKADIEERKRGASAMPNDLVKLLTKSEIRDMVEYLSTLKTPWKGGSASE